MLSTDTFALNRQMLNQHHHNLHADYCKNSLKHLRLNNEKQIIIGHKLKGLTLV